MQRRLVPIDHGRIFFRYTILVFNSIHFNLDVRPTSMSYPITSIAYAGFW